MMTVFCNLAWMKNYRGVSESDRPIGGGKYVAENGYAFECENFLVREDGKCYGFVETKYNSRSIRGKNGQNINIGRINPLRARYRFLEGIRVVFVAGGKIVGWYDNARVYPDRQYLNCDKTKPYYFVADSSDCHLIPEEERVAFSMRASKEGFGFGRSNIWYANNNTEPVIAFKKAVNNYIESINGHAI